MIRGSQVRECFLHVWSDKPNERIKRWLNSFYIDTWKWNNLENWKRWSVESRCIATRGRQTSRQSFWALITRPTVHHRARFQQNRTIRGCVMYRLQHCLEWVTFIRVYTSKLTPESVVTYLFHDCKRSLCVWRCEPEMRSPHFVGLRLRLRLLALKTPDSDSDSDSRLEKSPDCDSDSDSRP